ncbi:MAG TPA: hypothetical protein VMG81_05660 [Thermoplasmata archaeon]|nr:hypothetical protein [Thermoplasmata archaeon]
MTDPGEEKPQWKTGVLWWILALFLGLGTIGAATVVYGLLGIASGQWIDAVAVAIGAVIAVLAFLFLVGILYRVDRYRGATGRQVKLFE